ncbi:substance-K receptor-like [Oculina patagonica]
MIAVDRFGAVVFPHRFPRISSKLCSFFILATWIVAMAIGSPNLFTFKLVDYPGGSRCVMRWNEVFGSSSSNKDFLLAVYITFLFTPWVLITILYSIILLKLMSQKIPGIGTASVRQQRAKRERNVLKVSIAIVLGFAICWLPFSIIVLLHRFAWDPATRLPLQCLLYFSVARFMAHAHCALNICICFTFSGKYRQGIKGLLSCS